MDAEADPLTEPIFRPVKRRKFARRRLDDNSEGAGTSHDFTGESNEHDRAAPTLQSSRDGDQDTETANVVRLRRAHTARKGGIGFSATSRLGREGSRQTELVSVEDQEKERVRAMGDRFTGRTGQAVDVDKHMYGTTRFSRKRSISDAKRTNKIRMEYIDTEMARRYQRSPVPERQEVTRSNLRQITSEPALSGQQLEREPASLGKLHEIDLGQENKVQNIARTEAATRKLVGDEVAAISEGDPAASTNHPSTDEKPWRQRKRRTSADIERDRLVEEVLRESKLDVYDEPEDELHPDDQAADDRIAEQFRREFLDAIQSRRRLAKTRTNKTDKTEAPKGPKLGGSRSARAAMRDTQTKSGQR